MSIKSKTVHIFEGIQVLSVREYAELLKKRGMGVSDKRLYQYIDKKGMPHMEEKYGALGRRIWINPVEADAWIEARSKKLA